MSDFEPSPIGGGAAIDALREEVRRYERDWLEACDSADKAEDERDALAAHLDNLPDALRDLTSGEGYCCCGMRMDTHSFNDGHAPVDSGWYAMEKYMQQAPATSLARRDARMKAEALEETAKALKKSGFGAAAQCARIRAQLYRDQSVGVGHGDS